MVGLHCAACDRSFLPEDTLTPVELAAEGFPDMAPDDFWAMLEDAGNVADDGTCCRIEFEYV